MWIRTRITLIECDLRDLSSAQRLLDATEPIMETLYTNTVSQVKLLEAIRTRRRLTLRPSDVPHLLTGASKVFTAVGRQPEIPFEQIFLETVEYWRRKTKATAP